MGNIAKWIGAFLGFVFFGFKGMIFGFFLGSIIDSIKINPMTGSQPTSGEYSLRLLELIAAMLKADGKILRSELDYVKRFLVQNFGEEGAQEALGVLKEILKRDIPVEEVCEQIAAHVDYSSRLQLLDFLNSLAYADGAIDPAEERLLDLIALKLRITASDKDSLRAMFKNTREDLYKILEIKSDATDEQVKKAYRKMAVKYHPDKVAYLGDEVKKAANEKFQKLVDAYDKIKKERGMV